MNTLARPTTSGQPSAIHHNDIRLQVKLSEQQFAEVRSAYTCFAP